MNEFLSLPQVVFFLLVMSNSQVGFSDTLSWGDELSLYLKERAPDGIESKAVSKSEVNWAQPPLGCVEEMVPTRAPRPCFDLTNAADPWADWPSDLSLEERSYWYAHRRYSSVCRSEEILRRENLNPGSQNAGSLSMAWLVVDSVANYEEKVNAVYEASRVYGVPAHILTGALYQESLFAQMGISDDGGNFSCGLQQINIIGWCEWANEQSGEEKSKMHWPDTHVNCLDKNLVQTQFIRPFYEIAKQRLGNRPAYQLKKEHFAHIPLESVVGRWPEASEEVQALRYQLIRSFIDPCSDATKGIMAKGRQLQILYDNHVSSAFQNKDRYNEGEAFHRVCLKPHSSNAYPLHTGWLLAVAAYNAGPSAIEMVGHYNRWSELEFNDPEVTQGFHPNHVIESLFWGGKYNPESNKIEFLSWRGKLRSWSWFKSCIVQRHIARVIRHVTYLPEFFIDSLEGEDVCNPTSVPLRRQTSSGIKEN